MFKFCRGASAATLSSRTKKKIAAHAMAAIPASATNPARHDVASMVQASGGGREQQADRADAQRRAVDGGKAAGREVAGDKTVHTKRAGPQPMPVRICPATSTR